jgi:hypothetical protein
MKKETIKVKVGANESVAVDAYITDDPKGLAIHRDLQWVPAKGEHKFVSTWTVTHINTGYKALGFGNSFDTMKEAFSFTKLVRELPWEADDPREVYPDLKRTIIDAVSKVKDGWVTKDEDEDVHELVTRYVVRKGDIGYLVIDINTELEVERFMHRGMAANFARDKNAKESL